MNTLNEVVWTPAARSTFQRRIWGISDLIPRGNYNAWPVCMLLRTSRICRPPLVGRKSVRKQKKYIYELHLCNI
jgi:hypothetical protein